ncbi:hypothetical protein [Bacillus sp. m3-13]|uniref:hypothetical protein n=1 Tax=Bacillus sp. m3-13 TaxID=406124 RepID=UPI000315D902|nr:hypothetical protein [Bacillus sp. m3-13]
MAVIWVKVVDKTKKFADKIKIFADKTKKFADKIKISADKTYSFMLQAGIHDSTGEIEREYL